MPSFLPSRNAAKTDRAGKFICLLLVWFFLLPAATARSQAEAPPPQKQEGIQKNEWENKIREIGEEITRIVMKNLQRLLEEEIARLKKSGPEARKEIERKIRVYREALEKNPQDAGGYFFLGELYDDLGDGANAIIHTRKAEKLFRGKSDIKGMAKARKTLRSYYRKYGYQPEDFIPSSANPPPP